MSQQVHVYIVSDATGKTGSRVVQAALMQFDTSDVVLERRGGVQDEESVRKVVEVAAHTGGLIVHTLVSTELRREMLEAGRRHGIITIDLLGPVLTRLTEALRISPKAVPGLFEQLDDEYFARIEAIEYTVNHDDGRNPEDLDEADLVLVGVSRTGKTPVSIFMAYRGWWVANVPIVLDMEPPSQLFKVDRRRVVALTAETERLIAIRKVRAKRLTGDVALRYATPSHVEREKVWFQKILRRGVWQVVDITFRSIEETAAELMELVHPRRRVL
jgi:[pyruvate, water dikinase]-phosphate phosphotransferase / [pyruvate, water dikinase] kinase